MQADRDLKYLEWKIFSRYYVGCIKLNILILLRKTKMQKIKRSWVEINLNIIQKNYDIYSKKLHNIVDVMAVIKADGYGHGAVPIALTLQQNGCNNFAVSNINEAIELREAGIVGQILILGYTPIENSNSLFKYDITQAIISEQYAYDLIATGYNIKCQYAIDTGMNRIGLNADDPNTCEQEIRKIADKLTLTGVFTHLCVADTAEKECVFFTNEQINKFKRIVERISDLNLPYIHCLNTAGGLWHYDSISNMVRLGICLYGLKPDYSNTLPEGIEPAMEWKSVISMIKIVHMGETIGYGRTYTAEKEMKIATVPTGYADGYSRKLSNKGYVLIKGKRAPIVGRVCMDQFMIDISDIQNVKLYDEVILIGKSGDESLTADEMAQMLETIGYEVICDVGKRVPRVYN